MLSKRSQTQKSTYAVIPFVRMEKILMEKITLITRNREYLICYMEQKVEKLTIKEHDGGFLG